MRALFSIALALLLAGSSSAAWLNDSWTHRLLITHDPAAIVGGAKTNFPVVVKLNSAHTQIFDTAKVDGSDICFTKAGGDTLLAFERVEYDPVTQTAEFWVLVPAFGDARNTVYLYWGNDEAQDQSTTAIWADYAAVVHFQESSDYGPQDSGPNDLHLIANGYSGNVTTTGVAGRSWIFSNGRNVYTTELNLTAKRWTLQCWANSAEHGTDFIAQGDPGWFQIAVMASNESHDVQYKTGYGGTPSAEVDMRFHNGNVDPDVWNFLVVQMVAAGDSVQAYLNGVLDASATIYPPGSTVIRHGIGDGEVFGIGSTQYVQPNGPDSMHGLVDEFRIRAGDPLPAEWIQTEYNMLSNYVAFASFGSIEVTPCE